MSGAALAAPGATMAGDKTRQDWFRRQARVFLLDFQVPDQQEVIPVHGLRVHVEGPLSGSSAKLQPGGRTLPCRTTGGRMTVELDRVDIWEVVEIA